MKYINSKEDLAINGAPPAFKQNVCVGSPNVVDINKFIKYSKDIFDRNYLTNNGPLVVELEKKVAEYHKVKHCIATCNGTVALEVAIKSLGLSGEVIVPSFTFIATAHALNWLGVTPIFVDIDPNTHNIDVDSVRCAITKNTTAIIAVHLWGRINSVEGLKNIADECNIKLIYDAAHAFGCTYNGTMVGNFGDCEILSFHATKIFNSFEGGAIMTNDSELAKKARLMRNFGFSGEDNVVSIGTNGKMSEISAAMGLSNISHVDKLIYKNYKNYKIYSEEIDKIPQISLLKFDNYERNNYHYIVIELGKNCSVSRDYLIKVLRYENILARRYFWPGCHKSKPYSDYSKNSELVLKNTDIVSNNIIVLPSGAINERDIKTITKIILIAVSIC
jgi:dTDP-4-amino-4,6-dideoxygalactose transaminase